MSPWLAILAVVLAALSGLPAALRRRGGERIAVALLGLATVAAVASAVLVLIGVSHEPIDEPWALPGAALRIDVDPISAMFLLQIFALALLGAVFGVRYWAEQENGKRLLVAYGLTTAGMALLVIARNAVLFMIGWELMAIAAFVAVTTEDRKEPVRAAGYLYLVATRIGTLALIAMFVLLYETTASWDLAGPLSPNAPNTTAIFVLALVGFGLKAGIMPLHVWLPGAHANAPSHVSALMSGVLIKMGIYGFVRLTSLVPDPPAWWGGTLLALGLVSGVLGVALAIGQHDIKRLLAYHSVENIGIICMGLGLALFGRAYDQPALVVLGLGGALLHTWNHGLFKALLFLSAGAVVHATGTREIDRLGGLLKRMPGTALWFLVGAVAICGLPPLNGFVSELLVYLGFLDVARVPSGSLWLAGVFGAALLALVGGLAVACFVKVFGAVFLGEPRTPVAESAVEVPGSMRAPMVVLAVLCAAVGVAAPLLGPILDSAAAAWAPELATRLKTTRDLAPLDWLPVVYVPLIALTAALAVWLQARLARNLIYPPRVVVTWDCGYAKPTARMQYTASSFAQMLVGMFRWALRPRGERPRATELFPAPARFETHVPDVILDNMLARGTQTTDRAIRWTRWVQRGSTNMYVLYILVTLVVLLIWKGGA